MPYANLESFLQLSTKEQMIADKINFFLQQKQKFENELIAILKKEDLVCIIKIALHFSAIDTFCKQDFLRPYWEDIWSRCAANASNISYSPQRCFSCFDLVKSIYLYWEYLDQNKNIEESAQKKLGLDFLSLAAKTGCFAALRTFCFFYWKILRLI
jgi:hypothetical protein